MRIEFEHKPKHQTALNELYKKHGVGKTYKQKLAYWGTTCDGYCFSKKLSVKLQVRVFETEWLTGLFPQDFDFC